MNCASRAPFGQVDKRARSGSSHLRVCISKHALPFHTQETAACCILHPSNASIFVDMLEEIVLPCGTCGRAVNVFLGLRGAKFVQSIDRMPTSRTNAQNVPRARAPLVLFAVSAGTGPLTRTRAAALNFFATSPSSSHTAAYRKLDRLGLKPRQLGEAEVALYIH